MNRIKKKGRKDGGDGDCSVEEQSRASKWIPIHHGAGIFGASIFFFAILVQLGNWHRDTLVSLLLLGFILRKTISRKPMELTNVVSITGHPPRLIGYGVYASWANLLGIQTTLNKWSIAVSIGPVKTSVQVLIIHYYFLSLIF